MSKLYVLYEHALGYSLFSVKEFEDVGMFLPQVQSSVDDFSKFSAIVKLAASVPFKSAVAALENVNALSEGILPQDLASFLDDFFAKLKKSKCLLGVAEAKLGAAIGEDIGVQCTTSGVVPQILVGIRFHFLKLDKSFSDKSVSLRTAQIALGHSYSRAKIKFNVHRSDDMIIQAIALLDQMDKDVNTFSMRLREWYSYHFPELAKIITDNYMYARVVQFVKERKTLTKDKLEALEEIVMDSSRAQAIFDAAKISMGMDISIVDLVTVGLFADRVVALSEARRNHATYLHNKMNSVAPNLQTLIGDQVGARLISHAGSLTSLAKFPASTVQILGAEKALFRALKTRSNTPKYGLLYHSSFIGRAGVKIKGRISRFLANKCSIASKLDCFLDNPTNVYGLELKQQVEDRLKFYENGEVPRKNIDVMKDARQKAEQQVSQAIVQEESSTKKKNKKKKRKLEEADEEVLVAAGDATAENGSHKKKKRKLQQETTNGSEEILAKELQKELVPAAADSTNGEAKKKKKKKNKNKGTPAVSA